MPLGPDGCVLDPAHDPHAAIIFPSLPAGNLVERNPLPYHEPPYVPKPFLGRSIELQRLVLMLGRKRNKEVRMRVVAPTLAPALSPNGNPNPNPNGNPNPNPNPNPGGCARVDHDLLPDALPLGLPAGHLQALLGVRRL